MTTVIDPKNITDFNRTDNQLEMFWLFCISVAGKNSDTTSKLLSLMFYAHQDSPFDYLRDLGQTGIHNMLVVNRSGQYLRISKAFTQSLDLNLRTCTLEDLLSIHGVGPKTARFFLLHSRADCQHAVLDTHILKWMKDHGIDHAPDTTPQNQKIYIEYEKLFRMLAHSYFPGLSLAQADLLIWTQQSGRLNEES